jgi:hypothetical protein
MNDRLKLKYEVNWMMRHSVSINTDCADCTFILAIRVLVLEVKVMQLCVSWL